MPAGFRFECEPPAARVFLSGELDISVEGRLTNLFADLAARGCTGIEADLTAVTFVDAFVLALLRREQRRLREVGGDLTVVAGSSWYEYVVGLARYDTLRPTGGHERPVSR